VTGTGCSRTLTGSLPQSTGDLPAAVTILDNCDSGASCSAVDDEGAAMAEIVHDLAPGAEMLFHSAFNSEADFAQGITELAACGADIIVDDVLWFAEPMFQDGIIAQALESAVAGGVSYFSAAGNNGARSVDEIYLDANPGTDDEAFPTSGADLHDFGGNNRFGEITSRTRALSATDPPGTSTCTCARATASPPVRVPSLRVISPVHSPWATTVRVAVPTRRRSEIRSRS